MLNLSRDTSPEMGRIFALAHGCSVQKDHAEAFVLPDFRPSVLQCFASQSSLATIKLSCVLYKLIYSMQQ